MTAALRALLQRDSADVPPLTLLCARAGAGCEQPLGDALRERFGPRVRRATAPPDTSEQCVFDLCAAATLPAAVLVLRFEDEHGAPWFAPQPPLARLQRSPDAAVLQLVARGARGDGLVLARATLGMRVSVQRWLASSLRIAAALLRGLDEQAWYGAAPAPPPPSAPVAVGLREHIAHALRQQRARWHQRLVVEQWAVGVCDMPIERFVALSAAPPARWLAGAVRDGYLADPFEWDAARERIGAERYRYAEGRGELVITELRCPQAQVAMTPPAAFHRSYPFSFAEGGRRYLLPEEATSRCLRIYRTDDDGALQPLAVVVENVALADASLFRAGGRYWIAATDLDLGEHDNLCLWWADALAGPWRAHARNPVKIDITGSRPGGTPFFHEGFWHRPAQDCARRYGHAIVIQRIHELTPERFAEVPVARIVPDPRGPCPHGLHTLSRFGARTLIDGKRERWQLGELLRKLRRRLAARSP